MRSKGEERLRRIMLTAYLFRPETSALQLTRPVDHPRSRALICYVILDGLPYIFHGTPRTSGVVLLYPPSGPSGPAAMSTTAKTDAALKTYRGSCHCQTVVFSVTLPDIAHEKAGNDVCDCSFCAKRAVIWAWADPGALEFEKGLDGMKGYQFGAKSTTHYVSLR
jgi:hypothetical protein